LFLSAALLFVIEPMFAKMVLPLLGGAPAVWNTCLVFYQAALLAGYLYAHLSLKWLGPRRQAALHVALLCLPWVVLPIGVARGWVPPQQVFPVPWLWMLLSVSVGLPFFVVSASAPLLQAWFSRTGDRSSEDPYFLYAASNLGSLLALLAYPVVIESHWTLREQAWGWTGGYGLLMALVAGCAVQLWRSAPGGAATQPAAAQGAAAEPPAEALGLRRRLRWLALSFVPSSLLLGVTTYISTDLVAIPLLWVLPLALYLVTFVLVFARRQVLPLSWMVRLQPYLLVAAGAALVWVVTMPTQFLLLGLLHFGAFFVTAMVCHGQLAADRPSGSRLTEFYLWMSLGGVLGGLFNVLVAPLVFSDALEYPLMLAAACLLRPPAAGPRRPWRLWKWQAGLPVAVLLVCLASTGLLRAEDPLTRWGGTDAAGVKLAVLASCGVAAWFLRRRRLQFGLGVAALMAVSLCYPSTEVLGLQRLHVERSFFGVLSVWNDPLYNAHALMNGATAHGGQGMNRSEQTEPWTYYSRKGPLGGIFQALQPRRPLAEIGALGLGAGSIAAYGQKGERITFYEINPAVERIARDTQYFTYLADCRAKVEVVLGDARLSLVHGPPRQFDLLVLDAFTSDAVPVHLLTREALRLYFQRLADHGLLAIHISSRYFDLAPIVGRLAVKIGAAARMCTDPDSEEGPKKFPSAWVVMARRAEDLGLLTGKPAWKPLPDKGPLWTDDFSDVLGALASRSSWDWLELSVWRRSGRSQANVHHWRSGILLKQGRIDEAIAQFEIVLKLAPGYPQADVELAGLLAARGRAREAIAHYQTAVESDPHDVTARNNLAWLLATCPDASVRDGARAIELARMAIQLTDGKGASTLDTLATAYAEAGRFPEAVDTAARALDLATRQHNQPLVQSIKRRLTLYRARTAYRETPSSPLLGSPH
jgi:tetratricopeptide (TPR) repeat protein